MRWQSAYWIVSKFLSPKRYNRGKTQWTIKSFILQSSHIMILNSTKFGGNRTKDVEVGPDRPIPIYPPNYVCGRYKYIVQCFRRARKWPLQQVWLYLHLIDLIPCSILVEFRITSYQIFSTLQSCELDLTVQIYSLHFYQTRALNLQSTALEAT